LVLPSLTLLTAALDVASPRVLRSLVTIVSTVPTIISPLKLLILLLMPQGTPLALILATTCTLLLLLLLHLHLASRLSLSLSLSLCLSLNLSACLRFGLGALSLSNRLCLRLP